MAFARAGEDSRWPEGLMPYEISPDFDTDQRRVIEDAIRQWNERTIVRLLPRAGQDDYVLFRPAEDSCQSQVGRITGEQQIGCDVGDGFSTGSVIHEIGHAVGFYHEHQRPDRDQFVQILEGNIEEGKEHNFEIRPTGVTLGPYDYGSIMHYPRGAFADGGDTIVPLQDVSIGQRDGLSALDVLGGCGLWEAPHLLVAWEDDRDDDGRSDVVWAGLARWGKYCWGPSAVDEDGSADRAAPNVAIDEERSGVVVWQDDPSGDRNYRIRARCVAGTGSERFDELTVSTGTGSHLAPDIAMDPQGEFVVAWQTRLDGGQLIRARGFDRRGRQRWEPITVSAGAGGVPAGPAVAMATTGAFVVVWSELADESLSVRVRGFGPDGSERFGELTVAAGLGDQDVFPRVAVAGDGSFVVVWESGMREIRARGFGPDGAERFAEIAVNTRPAGDQMLADVSMNPAGRFVVVWSDDRDGNALRQLRARAFLPDGQQAVAEFTVNPRGGGQQQRPRGALDRTGRYYVVWEDDEDRNGLFQIHAQGLTPALAPVLKSFTVNTVWVGQQRRPAVASR